MHEGAPETSRFASPYRGLVPFSEDDSPLFFGRDRERQIIVANLLAYRLTLLYGESGVGKTSVLRAGAVNQLRRQTRESVDEVGTPEFVVVEFASWQDDPVTALTDAVDRTVRAVLGDQTPLLDPSPRRLDESLHAWAERLDTHFLIILDQFEEYFLYHGSEDGDGTFAVEFPRAVNRPDLRASFLVSIREDALARLDQFKGRIPELFGNYLRIRHLERDAARQAIVGPLEQYNRLSAAGEPPATIDPELVEAVLDQVKTGQVLVGESGQGIIAHDDQLLERIETPYLQLVMSRLWEEERAAGSSTLRLATLERLGGAERIVRSHLDESMKALPAEEREAAARVFRFLVTPGGTKIAHTAGDLAQYAEMPESQLGRSSRAWPEVTCASFAPAHPRRASWSRATRSSTTSWPRRSSTGGPATRRAGVRPKPWRESGGKGRPEPGRTRRRWGLVALGDRRASSASCRSCRQRQRSVQEAATLTFEALAQLDQDPQRSVRLALARWMCRPRRRPRTH
jgi:hypothetical protein